MSVIIEPSDDLEDFLAHVCTAIETKLATEEKMKTDETATPAAAPAAPENPEYMAMSRTVKSQAQRIQALEADKAATEEAGIRADLRLLVRGDALDKETARQWANTIGAKRLSLVTGKDQEVATIKATVAAMKKQLERKALLDPILKDVVGMSRGASPEHAPEGLWPKDAAENEKQCKDAAAHILVKGGYKPKAGTNGTATK